VLEREKSGYRLIDSRVVPISNADELAEVTTALTARAEAPYAVHLRAALELLSDRVSPDYRNSIKESISSVEAVCREITNDPNATLGQALKVVGNVHPAFAKGLSNIYGWTSDGGGIRHALTEGAEEPDAADAKFMLVACSAFVNYFVQKWSSGQQG
jgi:hypothetical protein